MNPRLFAAVAIFGASVALLTWRLSSVPVGGPTADPNASKGRTPLTVAELERRAGEPRPPATPDEARAAGQAPEMADPKSITRWVRATMSTRPLTDEDGDYLLRLEARADNSTRLLALQSMGLVYPGPHNDLPKAELSPDMLANFRIRLTNALADPIVEVRVIAVNAVTIARLHRDPVVRAALDKLASSSDKELAERINSKIAAYDASDKIK